MKKLLLFTLLLLVTVYSYSQNRKISGKVIDAKSNSPLSYVTISCKKLNGKIITGAITNDKGEFAVTKLPKEKITIQFQFIGYKSIEKNIDLTTTKSNYNIGIVSLQQDNTQLNEVEIQGETSTIIQKIDRKVINVGNDLTSAGSNSFDMLQNIPSIDVDQLSGNISLRGNDNVRVLVNGKPSSLNTQQLLKQIPSNSVKSIEIITSPSAKYTPEGMSGIINIILKKNTKIGFNGTISAGIVHSKNTRPEASLNLNYKTGNINFYGSYNTSWGDYATTNILSRTDKNLIQNLDFLNNSNSHSFKIGADIELNKKSTLSLYTNQSFDKNSLLTNTNVSENNASSFNQRSLSKYNEHNQDYNIDYVYKIDDKGQNIEIELNHSTNKNPEETINNETINPTSKLYNYNNDITDTRKLWLVNVDYTKPIKDGKLEFGLEFRLQDFKNNIITDQEALIGGTPAIQPVGNTNLNYDRSIYSGYVNFNKKFNKISIQTGIRLEQFKLDALFSNTQQGNTPVKDDIFSIYPSAYITYHITDKDDLQLGYSRRVDRPSAYQITPIQEWFSPLSISRGNINIRPQFTNSVELNYTKTIKKGYISLGTFYRRTHDKIGRLLQQDNLSTDRQIISFTNYDFADSYGFESSASFKPYSWWTLRPSFEIYVQDSEGILNGRRETIKNTRIKSSLSNSFKATKKLSFQLSAIHRGKSESIQYIVDPYTMINLAARLSVLDNKGRITLRANDIFNNVNFDYSSNNPFSQTGKYVLEYDSVYLGFSYNFGSGKNKAKRRKHRDDNESQGGLF
ncbi:hypothetical protein WH52_05370 [Tenacibaculum holothuriorum]|uniref:TonB-dependent receptor n=1 Tax=Tenacibaculum holothuriorum TaxID=1635173 RepID=A0A1Y2PCL0_9FLAO|nr:outer membrane beta-barrel family protein [Tenacibaculum holothuriorum]OSY88214.1 hypothetical protein WH52_05370 [Tenacibaculum holothuriorum]